MGKKNEKRAKPRVSIPLTGLIPVGVIVGETLAGRTGRFKGVIDVAREQGMVKALGHGGRLLSMEVIGYHGGAIADGVGNKDWDPSYLARNVAIVGACWAAHKVAEKSGQNRTVRRATAGFMTI